MTFNSSLSPGPAVLLGHELISRPGLHSPCERNQNRDKRYSEQRCEFRDDVIGVLKCIKLGSEASCRDCSVRYWICSGPASHAASPQSTEFIQRLPASTNRCYGDNPVTHLILVGQICSTPRYCTSFHLDGRFGSKTIRTTKVLDFFLPYTQTIATEAPSCCISFL